MPKEEAKQTPWGKYSEPAAKESSVCGSSCQGAADFVEGRYRMQYSVRNGRTVLLNVRSNFELEDRVALAG